MERIFTPYTTSVLVILAVESLLMVAKPCFSICFYWILQELKTQYLIQTLDLN